MTNKGLKKQKVAKRVVPSSMSGNIYLRTYVFASVFRHVSLILFGALYFLSSLKLGAQVQVVQSGPSHRAVQFPNESTGYAVAFSEVDGSNPNGVLRKSINGGVTWTTLPITFSPAFPEFPSTNTVIVRDNLQFINAQQGFCLGSLNDEMSSQNVLIRTNDGGQTWTSTYIFSADLFVNSICFLNSEVGFVAMDNGILQTTDGGDTFNPVFSPEGAFPISRIYFWNSTTGFASSNNRILKTLDGGLTWAIIPIASGTSPNYFLFTDANTGYFDTTTGGRIFKTTDGGLTWFLVEQEAGTRLTEMLLTDGTLVACGYSSTSTDCNTFFKTSSDNGTTWVKTCFYFPFPEPRELYSAHFFNINKAIWGVESGLIKYGYPLGLLPQVITGFTSLPVLTVGNTFDITGVFGGDSGNPIVFTSSDGSIASVEGTIITALAPGTITITATQAGNEGYTAAEPVTVTLIIQPASLLPQVINGFISLPDMIVGETYNITGVTGGGSGNPVVFSSSNTSVAVVSGNVITALAPGALSIVATQAGNATYEAADPVAVGLIVNAAPLLPQVINGFTSLPEMLVGETYSITGVTGGESGNPVVFSSSNSSVATVSGNVITAMSPGVISIIATQAGNMDYLPAEPVSVTLQVGPTSMQEVFSSDNSPILFPNPASGEVTVTWNTMLHDQVEVEVLDALGRKLNKPQPLLSAIDTWKWNVNDWEGGIYLIRITAGEKSGFVKLVVE